MLLLAWRGVRYNTGRYIATIVAIMTGVAFFTASGFLADRVIDALEGDANRQYGAVDAAIVVTDDPDAPGAGVAGELRIGGDVVEQIAALPEVAAVGGDLTGQVGFVRADGDTFADGATGRIWIEDDELNPIDIEEGAAPSAAGEIAVDQGLADDEDLAVGDQVTILTLAGPKDATIVAITSFGSADAEDQDGTVSIAPASAFEWLNSGHVEYQDLFLRGNVDQAALVAAVEPFVPNGFVVQPGDEFLEDKTSEAGAFGQFLKIALWSFAGIALFVGGFVIYNTFSVIVAQRLRELAVLSAVGATPKQIKRSLRFEGLVVGLIGSALGVLAGLGLTFVMIFLLEQLGVALPGSGIKVGSTTIILGLVAGTLITFFSVLSPARRAARTEPIEALRQSAVEHAAVTRKRIIWAAVLIVLGVVGMLAGATAAQIAVAAILLFVGVIIAGPILAVLGSHVFGPLLRRLGLEGRLAADNTARNPQRTATTANALLIGVFLVTLVTVAGTSLKDFAVAEINELSSADYILVSSGGTIDDGLISDLEAVEAVEGVVPFRREVVTISGSGDAGAGESAPTALSTGDFAAMTASAGLTLSEGTFDGLGPGRVLVFPGDKEYPIGSTVTFSNSQGDTIDLEVAGTIESSIDASFTGSLVDGETLDFFVGDTAATAAFVNVASGAQTDVEDSIEDITNLRPDIQVIEGNALGQVIGGIFDFVINAVNGLLLMSVLVAVIGIVNTLSLSILERRRELGLLRVVGMVDKRVRRMVRLESLVIAALGTITGMLLGIFVGLALVLSIDRLTAAGISLSLPPLQLLLVLVLGIGLGFLAALIPAKRSTRLEVLDAIQVT